MKVIYLFDESNPGEKDDRAIWESSWDLYSTLDDIQQVCRQVMKYEETPSDDRVELAEKILSIIGESRYGTII